ncbi:unnamed protein product [Ectocarpus fasciculatus]
MSNPICPVLGILSGISYVSGLDYYKGINEKTMAALSVGTVMVPNPSIILVSIDCDQYAHFLMNRLYDSVSDHVLEGVRKLVHAGCEMLVIASNTGHMAVPKIEAEFPSLQVLHIADCCAHVIKSLGLSKVALIGTKPTMEENYLKDRLARHGVQTTVPETQSQRDDIFRIIVEELSYNKFLDSSRAKMVSEIELLRRDHGVQACILGCTEIELLLAGVTIDGIALIPSADVHITKIASVLAGKIKMSELLPP